MTNSTRSASDSGVGFRQCWCKVIYLTHNDAAYKLYITIRQSNTLCLETGDDRVCGGSASRTSLGTFALARAID